MESVHVCSSDVQPLGTLQVAEGLAKRYTKIRTRETSWGHVLSGTPRQKMLPSLYGNTYQVPPECSSYSPQAPGDHVLLDAKNSRAIGRSAKNRRSAGHARRGCCSGAVSD